MNKDSSHFLLLLEFTPCKAEQPLRGMELHEKSTKRLKHTQEICLKRTYS